MGPLCASGTKEKSPRAIAAALGNGLALAKYVSSALVASLAAGFSDTCVLFGPGKLSVYRFHRCWSARAKVFASVVVVCTTGAGCAGPAVVAATTVAAVTPAGAGLPWTPALK